MTKNKSIFKDLGFSTSETAALILKAELLSKILEIVRSKNISPKDLEKLLGVPQPRVSELLNGKLSGMSLEKLVTYLEKLGIATKASFKIQKVG